MDGRKRLTVYVLNSEDTNDRGQHSVTFGMAWDGVGVFDGPG